MESSSESSQNGIDEMEMNTDVCLYLLAQARLSEDGESSELSISCTWCPKRTLAGLIKSSFISIVALVGCMIYQSWIVNLKASITYVSIDLFTS